MKRWRLAPLAKADLDEIWSYIASQGSTAGANRLIDKIEAHCDMLGRMPKAGRDASDLWPGARTFPVGNYIIYYLEKPRISVLISRIRHAARDKEPEI
jgi:toxin ParE1/3/4